MGSIQQRHATTKLLEEVNAIRQQYGGCAYSMGQVKGFVMATYGGGGDKRQRYLTDWLAVYTEFGPRFQAAGLTIDEVDTAFIGDPETSGGPESYRIFAEQMIESFEDGGDGLGTGETTGNERLDRAARDFDREFTKG